MSYIQPQPIYYVTTCNYPPNFVQTKAIPFGLSPAPYFGFVQQNAQGQEFFSQPQPPPPCPMYSAPNFQLQQQQQSQLIFSGQVVQHQPQYFAVPAPNHILPEPSIPVHEAALVQPFSCYVPADLTKEEKKKLRIQTWDALVEMNKVKKFKR